MTTGTLLQIAIPFVIIIAILVFMTFRTRNKAKNKQFLSKPKVFGLKLPEIIAIISGVIGVGVAWYFIFTYVHDDVAGYLSMAVLVYITLVVYTLYGLFKGFRARRK